MTTYELVMTTYELAERIASFTAIVSTLDDAKIKDAVISISTKTRGLSPDERFVRAHLIEEFIRRNGEEAGDRLMDEAGL